MKPYKGTWSEKVTTDNYVPNVRSHSQKNQRVMEGIKGKAPVCGLLLQSQHHGPFYSLQRKKKRFTYHLLLRC